MINVDWTLPVAAGIFIVTLVALNQLLFKPLFRVLEERKSNTSDQRNLAQSILLQYQSLHDHYLEKLKTERQIGYKLAESVREDALQQRQARLMEARQKAEALVDEARLQVHSELETARGQLRSEVDEIARSIASKILGRV
ncbi:MAG: hypothetical protein HY645_08135 [Acidobacteria bacterium]|nr:hypothetical protein [Acidobacteriota bacterium]